MWELTKKYGVGLTRRGYQVHQWCWGENATKRRSQGGLTLSCDGHWKVHKLQDDDGQTQTSVYWAGRSPFPPPPGRLEMPTVDGAAAAFACRSAALHLCVSCHFRMNDSAPSYTRRNHLPAFFAGVCHEGDTTIVATLCPIFLLVKHLKNCIFPLLRHATYPPHSDDDILELSERAQLSFVGQDLQEIGRETIGPYRLSVRQRTDRLLYFVPRRDIVQWSARGPPIKLVHDARIKGRRFGY